MLRARKIYPHLTSIAVVRFMIIGLAMKRKYVAAKIEPTPEHIDVYQHIVSHTRQCRSTTLQI